MGAGSGLPRNSGKRGSSYTDKQIAQSVKDGKAVRAILPDGTERFGWICGADDYHWGIVTRSGEVSMVHKSVPCLEVTPVELAHQDPDTQEVVERVLGGYRDYVMRTHFNAIPATT